MWVDCVHVWVRANRLLACVPCREMALQACNIRSLCTCLSSLHMSIKSYMLEVLVHLEMGKSASPLAAKQQMAYEVSSGF